MSNDLIRLSQCLIKSHSPVSLTLPPLLSHLARLQINGKIEIIVQGTPICYLGLPIVKILTHLHSLKIIHIHTFIHIYMTGLQIYEENLLMKIREGGKESHLSLNQFY